MKKIYTLNDLKQFKINFHFNMLCNMRCKFCFYAPLIQKAKYKNDLTNWLAVIKQLSYFGAINFAGGEPTIYWNELKEMAQLAKILNLKTTLITNGSIILKKDQVQINELLTYFDTVGISMDSVDLNINLNSGRSMQQNALAKHDYLLIADKIKQAGCQLKVNSVVHYLNKDQILLDFINIMKPSKWKIMQVSAVGQTSHQNFIITKAEFATFVKNNKLDQNQDFKVSIENEEVVTTSYVMIDGQGFFYNSDQINTDKVNSKSILDKKTVLIDEFNKCDFNLNSQLLRYENEA